METIDYKGETLHRWTCGPSTFLAKPEIGARLMNWNVRLGDGSVRDVVHWPEDADFANFAKVRGGNPILFPFSARTYDRGKLGFWRDKDGTVRAMPQHGFSRNGKFEIAETDATGFTAVLQPDEAAREIYPFDYRFSVRYAFEELSFQVIFTLENFEDSPIPWSAGHHFYFTLPWHADLHRKDYRIKLPAKACFSHGPDGELEPVKPFENERDFGDPELSDRIFSKLTGDTVVFGPKGGEEDVGIKILRDCEAASKWNAFVVWTEKPDSPFYCVEPWMGPPNGPEHGKGLDYVGPGAKSRFGVEVRLL